MTGRARSIDVAAELRARPRGWVVTGAAGFIGSHLVETLLSLDQCVRGLDDFSTGRRENLDDVARRVGPERWARFYLVEGDVAEASDCRAVFDFSDPVGNGVVCLHQAALGSVPRSIENPAATYRANVEGSVRMLAAAREASVERFVYASSSSVYGDLATNPRREDATGRPLSPYAASKAMVESWAAAAFAAHHVPVIGLRYFNVVGARQFADGPYAAVVPRWVAALRAGESPSVFGDGLASRDFCPVANVVSANLLAALAPRVALGSVFNVGLGRETSLLELFAMLRTRAVAHGADASGIELVHALERPGDVRRSVADIGRACEILGFEPVVDLEAGLDGLFETAGEALEGVAPGKK